MTWTTARPSVPGFYWFRDAYVSRPFVTYLDREEFIIRNPMSGRNSILVWPGEWAGPIPVPEEEGV